MECCLAACGSGAQDGSYSRPLCSAWFALPGTLVCCLSRRQCRLGPSSRFCRLGAAVSLSWIGRTPRALSGAALCDKPIPGSCPQCNHRQNMDPHTDLDYKQYSCEAVNAVPTYQTSPYSYSRKIHVHVIIKVYSSNA